MRYRYYRSIRELIRDAPSVWGKVILSSYLFPPLCWLLSNFLENAGGSEIIGLESELMPISFLAC